MHPVLCSFCSINTAFQASLLVFSTGMVARSAQISTKITFSGYGATHCLFHFGHFLKHLLQRLKKWLNLHILWSCSIYRIYYLRPALTRQANSYVALRDEFIRHCFVAVLAAVSKQAQPRKGSRALDLGPLPTGVPCCQYLPQFVSRPSAASSHGYAKPL